MKSIETLCKNITKLTYDDFMSEITLESAREYFNSYLNKDNFDTTISDRLKLSMLVYKELKKALDIKRNNKVVYELVLDCNYEKSKNHNSDKYLVDYYSLLTSDRDRAIQFYVTLNVNKKEVYFRLCTSCKKVTRMQFEQLKDDLKFIVKYDKKTNRAKTSQRTHVNFDNNEIVNVVKSVLAVLNSDIESIEEKAQ